MVNSTVSTENTREDQARNLGLVGRLRQVPLFQTIRGKVGVLFAVTFFSVCLLTVISVLGLYTVRSRLTLGERYDDLLNNMLEVRRFEKNYLFYNNPESLDQGLAYLQRINDLVGALAADMATVAGEWPVKKFRADLAMYEQALRDFRGPCDPDMTFCDAIRARGKALLDFADNLRRAKRARIHTAIVRTSILPFAFLAVFLLLMFLVGKLIWRNILKPLDLVQRTTDRVARGDFSPVPYESWEQDEITQLVGAFNRMARELEDNQEYLLQSRKIAALGTFTAGIAHELNNPINNISLTAESYLEFYREKLEPDELEMINDVLSESDRASDIVRDLLDFSRTERPNFSSLSMREVIGGTLNLLRNHAMLGGVRLETDIPADLPPVMGNLRNLQQIFMNLALNAIQAMENGGLLRVSAALADNDTLCVAVEDTGKGIPPEQMEHIFEPFFTTKGVGRGTGLGLAVTYSLVKRHNGRIDVKSEPGQGSTFTVHLPLAKEEQPADA